MEQKVHVEAPRQGLVRLSPLGNHGRIGKLLGQKAADLLPQSHSALALRVVFDQGVGHIHPEPVTAHLEPKAHDILHGLQSGPGSGGVHGLLPRPGRPVEAVVQGGLVGEKVDGAGSVPV